MGKKVPIPLRGGKDRQSDQWVENRASASAAPKVEMKRMTFDLPEDLHAKLKSIAGADRKKLTDIFRDCAEDYVRKNAKKLQGALK